MKILQGIMSYTSIEFVSSLTISLTVITCKMITLSYINENITRQCELQFNILILRMAIVDKSQFRLP